MYAQDKRNTTKRIQQYFATFSLLGGKIEHSNIYDLWIMIYDLHFGHKGTIKKRDTQEKKKKNHGGHPVNNKTWYYMPDTIRRNGHRAPALDAYRAGEVITRRDAGMNGTNVERVPAQR